jgi:hypothetical protein
VIVLLTDGDNVMSSASNPNKGTYSGYGYAGQGRLKTPAATAKIDGDSIGRPTVATRWTAARENCAATTPRPRTCRSIRSAWASRAHSKRSCKACATKLDMYYDVTDAAQLTSVFNTIAGSIQNLRITK